MDIAKRRRRSRRPKPPGQKEGRRSHLLPEDVYLKIFCSLPAREIASSCALVCRSWRVFSSSETLWKELCGRSGLRDGLRFASWRSLYGIVYGTNLIASPHFERLDRIDAERLKCRFCRDCEPKNAVFPDRIYYENERHEEPHSFCHWTVDGGGGSQFQRGGGDGITRECPPEGCPPCPSAPEKPVLATSYDWGKVYQNVDLSHFPRKFLDRSPPLLISVWYAGKRGTTGLFRIQLGLRDKYNNVLLSRFSGNLRAQSNKWREAKQVIHGYPRGMRSIVVKLSGMSVGKKLGFQGTKYTAVQMQFIAVPEAEVNEFAIRNSAEPWPWDRPLQRELMQE